MVNGQGYKVPSNSKSKKMASTNEKFEEDKSISSLKLFLKQKNLNGLLKKIVKFFD